MKRAVLACQLILVPIAGCSWLSRGEALKIAYYEPELPTVSHAADPSPGCELDLGRVDAAGHLRDDIEYRSFPYQVGYYSERRWTESPDRYLRRALELGLFEGRQCVRSLSGYRAILDATLVSFAEVRAPASARVGVHFVLHDGPRVLADATVEVRRPAEGAGNFDAVVRALSDGLAEVVAQIVRQVQLSMRNAEPG